MTFEQWQTIGIQNKWVSPTYCATHDGGDEYMTQEERQEWEDGNDPCQLVMRILEQPC